MGESGALVLNDAVLASSGEEFDEVEALISEASHIVEQTVEELRPARVVLLF